jgi:hypothetical protein
MNTSHVLLKKNAIAERCGMLVVLPAFFLLSTHSFAAVIVDNGNTLNIDSTTPLTDYLVRNASCVERHRRHHTECVRHVRIDVEYQRRNRQCQQWD